MVLTAGSADILLLNVKKIYAMTQAVLQGIAQNPVEEISAKVQQYFKSHGFKEEGQFDKNLPLDGDFAFELFGTMDDVQLQVVYQDYKPKKEDTKKRVEAGNDWF